jgi:hypothetical protein
MRRRRRTLGQIAEMNPILWIGGALGAGYVAGGGLATALTRRLVRTGGGLALRLLLLPALQQAVRGLLPGRER